MKNDLSENIIRTMLLLADYIKQSQGSINTVDYNKIINHRCSLSFTLHVRAHFVKENKSFPLLKGKLNFVRKRL